MRPALVAVVVLVAASGCRRHPHGANDAGGPSKPGGRALSSAEQANLEGTLDSSAGDEWKRALALRELGLLRGAAAAFDAVKAADAKTQAAQLRERLDANQREWHKATAAGKALVDAGAPPPAKVLQRFPSYMRQFLYHAVRAAPTAARVRGLAPLAATLDARQGGDTLSALVAKTAARDLKARAPLAATYGKLAINPAALDKTAAEAYLAALRRAHEDELLLGTLVLLQRTGDEALKLARATDDPWYRALAAELEAQALVAHDQLTTAESVLVPALDECRAHKLDYRCVHLEATLVDVYRRQHRNDDALRLGKQALADAHEHARAPLDVEAELLLRLGDAARERPSFALMDAFFDEALRANPESCESRRTVYESSATARLSRLDAKGARAAIDRSPRCQQPMTLRRANVVVELARLGLGGDDLAEAKKTLGEAGGRHYAHLTRAVDAALADDGATALAELAADAGASPPKGCALAAAVDGERSFAVAKNGDGELRTVVDRHRTSPAIDVTKLVPLELRAFLVSCTEVAVYAPPPLQGLPDLLPPEIAWSYRLRATPLPLARGPHEHRVVVTNPQPPPSLALPPLADWRSDTGDAKPVVLEGAAATPARVLSAMGDAATEIEIHAHGILDLGLSDASALMLSPEPSGRFALTAREIARAGLHARPVVILAAGRAVQPAEYRHDPFGLPLAFVQAGAAAVITSAAPIGDAFAAPFFATVLARVRDGRSPARALRDERMRVLGKDAGSWVRQLVLFQ